jgi:regulatory protein
LTDSAHEAKRYSFKLLSYRGRSESELEERLRRKGYSETVITAVLKDLKLSGYLDDAALALQLKRIGREKKLLGHKGIRLFLQKRGISGEVADQALDYDEDEELRSAQRLIEKRLRFAGSRLDEGGKRRLRDLMIRRGYSFDVIRKTMKNLDFQEVE